MLARAKKLWDEHCKPRAKHIFKVIDKEKEEVPQANDIENLIEVYFVT